VPNRHSTRASDRRLAWQPKHVAWPESIKYVKHSMKITRTRSQWRRSLNWRSVTWQRLPPPKITGDTAQFMTRCILSNILWPYAGCWHNRVMQQWNCWQLSSQRPVSEHVDSVWCGEGWQSIAQEAGWRKAPETDQALFWPQNHVCLHIVPFYVT